jgi:hypothetical protein
VPGILIRYKHAPSHPGFWYECTRAEVNKAIAAHHDLWGREHVGGVTRAVPVDSLVVTYCTAYRAGVDGQPAFENAEVIDAAAVLK